MIPIVPQPLIGLYERCYDYRTSLYWRSEAIEPTTRDMALRVLRDAASVVLGCAQSALTYPSRLRTAAQEAVLEEPRTMEARALPSWIENSRSCTAKFFRCYYTWAQKCWHDEALLLCSLLLNAFLLLIVYCLVQAFFIPVLADSIRYYALQWWWGWVAMVQAAVAGQDPMLYLVTYVCVKERGKLFQRRLDAEKAAQARAGKMEEVRPLQES